MARQQEEFDLEGRREAASMYASRWLTLSASTLLQCSAGVSYCFSIYSSQLKDALGYNQTQIEGLASPLVALLVVGWLPGFAYDRLKHRRHLGPRLVLLWGLTEHFCGYFGLWLAASGRLQLPYWAMVGLTVMAFNGSNWIDTACIATNVHNFPHDRGTVVGVLKSLVGLSASVYTSMYVAAFRPDALSFLLLIAVAPTALGLCAMPLFNALPEATAGTEDENAKATGVRFGVAYNVVITLGLYQLCTCGLLGAHNSPGPVVRRASLLGAMLAGLTLLLAPLLFLWVSSGRLLLPGGAPGQCGDEEKTAEVCGTGVVQQGAWARVEIGRREHKGGADLQAPLLGPQLAPDQSGGRDGEVGDGGAMEASKAGAVGASVGLAQPKPNLKLWECAASLNFWLLFLVFGVGTGIGLMFVNNLGQLVESLGGGRDGQDVLVSLFSVFSAAGRLACGSIPERLLHSYGLPRTLFLVVVSALTAAVCALSALSRLALLWAAAPAAGFAFGCHWSLMPPLAGELFGMRNFATLYCLLQFGTTFGTYALATRLAGGMYQLHAERHGDDGDSLLGWC
ncbi:Nodulin-like-domain-containing protein [Coccomyxa subellipsoidea C-169]|uniref:Nodulin-like-domain-containing protein n=1 Tax=Coccomyxa subellipsoidea (strain C-169) TaxID=574566 RepID=I0YL60_COCSC|nr:Nodulin-like-domain-containing protein [Coccomyxa subellipsoidea C-169]EIE19129.1 Nodulin-like-domain-containing protein [Coccomyxa subellipsoidea C-169]|eukprot:XP_005643673.1 Nodulin-like-domain-containing protein [Coccomyxa subellipsoidea C-169]